MIQPEPESRPEAKAPFWMQLDARWRWASLAAVKADIIGMALDAGFAESLMTLWLNAGAGMREILVTALTDIIQELMRGAGDYSGPAAESLFSAVEKIPLRIKITLDEARAQAASRVKRPA